MMPVVPRPMVVTAARPAIRMCAGAKKCSVVLINDGFNMREYVARVLMMVAYVSESEANAIMMQANWEYSALVGTWEEPLARHIYQGLKKAGLETAISAVDDDSSAADDDSSAADDDD